MALPDLDSLRCFIAVARSLHFRIAAEQVALSPTAFGERIRRLEEDLGVSLLERSTRQVALTAEGEQLLPAAERLVAEAEGLGPWLRQGSAVPFELTLGTRFELGLSWLVPALGPLQEARPERTLHLRFGDSADLLRAVERGEIDAAVTSVRLTQPNLTYAPLHEERYVLVSGPDCPCLAELVDLTGHTLLDAHLDLPLFRYLLDAQPAQPAQAMPQFGAVHYLGTIAAIAQQVRRGLGVAVLPAYYVQKDLAGGTLRQQLAHLPVQSDLFRLVWRRHHPHNHRLKQLAAELAARPLD